MDQGTLTQPSFLTPFRKQWPKSFSGPRVPPNDRSWLEELKLALQSTDDEPLGDDAHLFFLTYDDGQASLDVQTAVKFVRCAKSSNLCDQVHSKKGTAWLDDRYFDQAEAQNITGIKNSCGGFNASSATGSLSSTTDRLDHASSEAIGCTTERIQGSTSASARDVSDSTNSVIHASSSLPCANIETLLFRSRDQSTARCLRLYHAPLTAAELNALLREKRFFHPDFLDAHRRLVCVPDPDSFDLYALMRNATAQEQRALKDSICSYLGLHTSIKAIIPEEGYREFRLTFDIPFLALRHYRSDSDFQDAKNRTHRGCMNVSFLDTKQTSPDEDVWGIHLAHVSVAVCGVHESNWSAYCLEDRYYDEDSEIGPEEQTADHQNDQIALGEFSAETIISDPREYFLRILLIRMRRVRKEWSDSFAFIEKGIANLSWGRSFFSSTRSGISTERRNDATTFDTLESTLDLLGKMLGEISKLNSAWACFIAARGGFEYFLDMHRNERMVGIRNQLDDVFGEMLQLQGKLRHLAAETDKKAQTVTLRLASESKKNAELTMYIISPIAVVSTFFAIPVPILDFDRNFFSFGVAIALCVVGLHGLLFLWGGKLWRQPWWEKISRRAKAAWNGDPSLTSMSQSGEKKLRRRPTHPFHA